MAKSEQKRQKQLMKKRQQEKRRKQAQAAAPVPFHEVSPRKKIMEARRYPIHQCLINNNWRESGLANIMIARRQPDGRILFGFFLVDLFALGVKSTFANTDFSLERFEREVTARAYPPGAAEPCTPELAHAIIYRGLDFAAQHGVPPDKDYALTQHILEERGKLPLVEVPVGFEEGTPLVIPGPNDKPASLLSRIKQKLGLEKAPAQPEPGEEVEEETEETSEGVEDDEEEDLPDTPDWDRHNAGKAFDRKYKEWQQRDWRAWLGENLQFPFTAERFENMRENPFEPSHGRPFAVGHTMRVTGLDEDEDELEGLLARVEEGQARGLVPLGELEVTPRSDPNFWPVREYVVWIANQ